MVVYGVRHRAGVGVAQAASCAMPAVRFGCVEQMTIRRGERPPVEVHTIENAGDVLLREPSATSSPETTDALVVIRWKDIHEQLESASMPASRPHGSRAPSSRL